LTAYDISIIVLTGITAKIKNMQLVSKLKYQVTATVIFAAMAVLLIAVQSVFADSASLSLVPGADSVSQGDTLSVGVYVNSAEPVNAASAKLIYQNNLLDFVDITSSPAFAIAAASSGGDGTVRIDRGALPAVSGRQLLATVNFKVKASSGIATISFTDGSAIVSANNNHNILSGAAGGRYAIGDSVPTPKPPTTQPPRGSGDSGNPLQGSELSTCKDHEQTIKNIMARIVDRGRKQQALYTNVAESTEALYAKNGNTLSNYNALVSDVNTKKAAALVAVSALEADSQSFSCDANNPRAQITEFKNELKTTVNALTAYRASVKDLITGVKSVQ
jgi:hypothetical protein